MPAWADYFWPGTDVLRNIPGIRDADALRRFEYAATRQRAEELRENPVQGDFDLAHLREIHRRLFQDVYPWAGQLRDVNMSKGASHFAPVRTPAHTLESWGDHILGELKQENHLKGLDTAVFVDRLTYHYGEQNFWHPFREGNGRATKEFLSQLANEAGYEIEYHRVNARTWNEAAARQHQGDPTLALDTFTRIVAPSRALAFRDEHVLDAMQRFPELRGAVNALYAAEAHAKEHIADIGDRRLFIAQAHAKLTERLRAGEIIQAPDLPLPQHHPQRTRDDYQR